MVATLLRVYPQAVLSALLRFEFGLHNWQDSPGLTQLPLRGGLLVKAFMRLRPAEVCLVTASRVR